MFLGARGGRGRGRGGSVSAAPAPDSDCWGTAGGEASATTQNTGQGTTVHPASCECLALVARGGARGRGSAKWASGPSAAATTTAHTEGFQTTVAPPPQQEEEDEWAVCVPAVGQQNVSGTEQRAEHGKLEIIPKRHPCLGARGGPTRRGAPAAARQPTEGYQNEPFGAPQKKDEAT